MMSKEMRLRRLLLSIGLIAVILIVLRLIQPKEAREHGHEAQNEATFTTEVNAATCGEAEACKCDTCPCCGCKIVH